MQYGIHLFQIQFDHLTANQLVLNKAVVKREMLHNTKARKLAYYGHTLRKQGSCLEEEIMQAIMPGGCRRGRPRTVWMDNIKTWTGLPVEESIRMTEINGESTSGSRTAKEQNSSHNVYACQTFNTPILQLSSSLGNLSVLRAYSGLPGGFQCGRVRKWGSGLQHQKNRPA